MKNYQATRDQRLNPGPGERQLIDQAYQKCIDQANERYDAELRSAGLQRNKSYYNQPGCCCPQSGSSQPRQRGQAKCH